MSMINPTPTLLLVDDEPFNIEILLGFLDGSGYAVETAGDGAAAWRMLRTDPIRYDVVLLDRMMPGLNGIELLERIKQHPVLQSAPVIMLTAVSSKAEILEGLRAGAYYHLTMPLEREMLLSVINTAVKDRMRYNRARHESVAVGRSFGLMRAASFAFQTLEAARDLAILLANACPDPQRVVVGLTELLLNAVEHGNLGITYREKGELCEEERWEQEVASRLAHPLNADKEVQVRFTRGPEEIRLVIRDQGDGFDWQAFLEMDPARANDSHGRGIAMARLLSFDSLEYRGCGNEVEVAVRLLAD